MFLKYILKSANYKTASNKRTYFRMVFVVLFSIGLFGSLKTTFGLFGVDSDTSHSAMLWYGIRDHGMNFIKEWLFTPDNWLFSLFPIHFSLFTIFGPKPFIVILTGWLIFIASVLLSGIIAKNLNAPKSAWVIPVVLIFSGLYAHQQGLLSYSTSHNITNLFGLFSFYCLVKWIKTQKMYLLTLIVLLTVAGGLSDAWIIGAYTLPLTIASLFLLFSSKNITKRKAYFFLFLAMIFSLITIKTQIFGTLSFLPSFHFSIGSWNLVNSNAVYVIKDLGGLLNFVPGSNSNTFIPSLFSVFVFLFLMIGVTRLVAKRCLPQDHLRVVFYFIAFSIGGMLFAVLMSDNPAQNNSARFFVNVLYMAVIGAAVVLELNWDGASMVLKLASALAGFMFITAGIISNYHLWKVPGIVVKDNNILAFIDFLSKNKLNYGYGPYWGSLANATTWLSESKIKIRPVVFNRITGHMVRGNRPESSKLWYLSDDAPVNQQSYFVFVKSDGEECPDINLCINGLARQFGAPERVLPYNDGFILVWAYPLVEKDAYITYDIGGKFVPGRRDFIWQGWSGPEAWGTWSDGNRSSVLLDLSTAPKNDLELLIEGHAFLAEKHPTQEIDVVVNKHLLATLMYDQRSNGGVRTVKIPKFLASENDGRLLIYFNIKNPKSPAELGTSGDSRRLGLGIVSLEVKTAD